MPVAPSWMCSVRMLYLTIREMAVRLAARRKRLAMLLPISRIKVSATMLMPVTTRNIRSCRPIRWSKMCSSHFLIIR